MPLEAQILDNEADAAQLAPLLADAEIVVGHIWRAGFPPAPRLRLLQSVAAGLDLLDSASERTLPLQQRLRARARELAIEWRDINGLVPYARNARTHSEAQIAQIAGS